MFVEGTIKSPLEDEIAYKASKQKIPYYSTDQFEKLYASELNSDSVLMSLKLSNNQERLARLMQNRYLDDKLFLKLFGMYDWGEDGLFDNSENMEITTLFTKRFYKKERFDPATFHSPISIFEIAIISEDERVLEALFSVPTLSVKQSRLGDIRPTTIKEALATNTFLNRQTKERLLRLNDAKVDYFLAQNSILDIEMLEKLFERNNTLTNQALATNKKINDVMFKALLKEPLAVENLLLYQNIDLERYKQIQTLHESIADNENLSDEVISALIESKNEKILQNLSANESIKLEFLETIFETKNPTFYPYLAANKNLSEKIIKELHEKKDTEINNSLAFNTSTPMSILEEFYKQDDFELNCHLALNESLPLAYLQQLQLDTRLMNYLKENKTFTENILNNLGI